MSSQLWQPHLSGISAIEKLQHKVGVQDYAHLHSWSIKNPGEFWSEAWDDCEIVGEKGSNFYSSGSDFISAQFFINAKINVTENLLAKGADTQIAIVTIA